MLCGIGGIGGILQDKFAKLHAGSDINLKEPVGTVYIINR